MGIIDIHTHILYGIDDGAENYKMSLKLMGMDYAQGVRGIFLTNHSYGMEYSYKDYHRRFEKLQRAAKERYPDLTLYKGCEVLCNKMEMDTIIQSIRNDIFPSMNGTKYVLTEFDPYGTAGMSEMKYCLEYVLDKGYIPIVAHVERYQRIYDDPLRDISRISELGCKIQINLYSVAQDSGQVGGGSRKTLANLFLSNHLVDFVGTDTHRLNYKSPEAAVGAQAIRDLYGNEYADKVLYQNVETILLCQTASGEME